MYLTGDTAEAAGTAGPASGPSAGLYLTEPARGLAGLAFLPLAAPWLATAPRGDGHGVLVVPGFLATDTSTALLRRFLRRLGYDVRGTSSSDSEFSACYGRGGAAAGGVTSTRSEASRQRVAGGRSGPERW